MYVLYIRGKKKKKTECHVKMKKPCFVHTTFISQKILSFVAHAHISRYVYNNQKQI